MKRSAYLILMLTVPAYAGTPWTDTRYPREEVTVDLLYETCWVVGQTAHGMIRHFDCESYVYGTLDSHLAVRESLPKNSRACFPPKMAPWEALRDALPDVKGAGKQNAGVFLIASLRRKYPCN